MRRRSTPADAPPIPDDLRCRRSNGKDWRCSEQALPDLSYCSYHHRLNYHRPQPSSSSGRRPSRRKDASAPALGIDGCIKADREDSGAGSIGDGTPFVKRQKRRRKEGLMCFQETGSPNFQSNKDVTMLNITGDESSLSDPIYDAVPVRCRQINDSTITDLLSSNSLVQEMNTDELSISDTVFGALPVPDEYRCKRSNGKEWRCTEQALPGLSYCPYHHHLNYNRPPSKTRGTSRTSPKTVQQPDPNKLLCRRTNGKGWQCPNPAVEGLSYCPYHHQLNYRGGASSLASKDASRISHVKIKSQKMVPEEEVHQRHELLLDGLQYTF